MDAVLENTIHKKYELLGSIFDERGRRLRAAIEASQLGRGGVSAVSRATGLSRTTIYQGMAELEYKKSSEGLKRKRVRVQGGGRKGLMAKDPGILEELEKLVDPSTRGDPESPLRWTCKSTRQLADALRAEGHSVGRQKVSELVGELGYSLQANRKLRGRAANTKTGMLNLSTSTAW